MTCFRLETQVFEYRACGKRLDRFQIDGSLHPSAAAGETRAWGSIPSVGLSSRLGVRSHRRSEGLHLAVLVRIQPRGHVRAQTEAHEHEGFRRVLSVGQCVDSLEPDPRIQFENH